MRKQLKYIQCEVSRRELWECQFTFFSEVNYTMTSSFSFPKTVNLSVFYCKITLNVPLYITVIYRIYKETIFLHLLLKLQCIYY